jgi:hypothetical protein
MKKILTNFISPNNMTHIGIDELIFHKDEVNGIYSGGFNVKSIMLKNGTSPIATVARQYGGDTNQVSDLFDNLVVPNWLLSQPFKFSGGGEVGGLFNNEDEDEDEYEDNNLIDKNNKEDNVIDDDLHDKLLDLVSAKTHKKPVRNTKRVKKHMKSNKKTEKRKRV